MATPILMPKPGQMTEECTLVFWRKHEGDPVRKGDILFEIETDKANMDVEAFDEGVLLRQVVAEGQTVPVNTVCGYIGVPGEALPEESPPIGAVPVVEAAAAPTEAVRAPEAPPVRDTTVEGGTGRPTGPAISPRAARLAASAGIDPASLAGTGPSGRVTERDVERAIAERAAGATQAPPGPPEEVPPQPLSRMRQVIAKRLSASATIPQFSLTNSVDVTGLLALRDETSAEERLGVTDYVLWSVARTLPEFPEVNSRTDGVSIWLRRRVDLGLAVAVPNGLVVPVIRDADGLSLHELHGRVETLTVAAREGSLLPDQLTGSSFTVTNLGMYDVEQFTSIVNPGEAAILAVSSVRPTPVAVGGEVLVRQLMKVTLTADHRIVDGEMAARFVAALRRRLQDPESFRGS